MKKKCWKLKNNSPSLGRDPGNDRPNRINCILDILRKHINLCHKKDNFEKALQSLLRFVIQTDVGAI